MFGRIVTVVTLAAMIALLLVIQSTNPATAGPVGILAVFFLLYIIFVGSCTWGIHAGSLVLHAASQSVGVNKISTVIPVGKAYYYGSVIALGPIMLLAMKSVAEVGVYEIGLVSSFVFISLFYVKKRFH